MEKRLYRSRTNRTFAGVCGGLGLYLNIDPTLVRVLWVVLSLFTTGFPGLIVYIILACVVPEEPQWAEGYGPPPNQPYQQGQPPYQQAPYQQPPYPPQYQQPQYQSPPPPPVAEQPPEAPPENPPED